MEFVGQTRHQISRRAALTQEAHPLNEVCDDVIESVAVLNAVPRMQHALVQHRPEVVPVLPVTEDTESHNETQRQS